MAAIELNDLAQQLATARGSRQLIDPTPFDAIASLKDAYRIQSMAAAAHPSKQIGYKVGATNAGVQKLFDCNAPFYGPMFEQEMRQPAVELELHDGLIGGEAEF